MEIPMHMTLSDVSASIASSIGVKGLKVPRTNAGKAPETFYDDVRSQVEESIPGMEPGERYTLEMLCGAILWSQLDDGQRRKAGVFMSRIVAEYRLPLRVAITKHEYPKWYELK